MMKEVTEKRHHGEDEEGYKPEEWGKNSTWLLTLGIQYLSLEIPKCK